MQLDSEWGCRHSDVSHLSTDAKVAVYLVNIDDINTLANSMCSEILDKSWMYKLNADMQLSYRSSANETIAVLVEIFKNIQTDKGHLTDSFGESLITMASARLLECLLQHHRLPIAEIWKPQKKQNEGFDFHTICTRNFINFGEAKYSRKKNPYHDSIVQIDDFLSREKHFRDMVHLEKLAPGLPYENLASQKYGVVASFSLNGKTEDNIIEKAIQHALGMATYAKFERIYIIGVRYAV